MNDKTKIALFEDRMIRRYWDEGLEKWFFSVTDVVTILSDSVSPLAYWRKLKERLKKEGSEIVTECHGFKMPAADGKMRITDMADTETMFRIVQSIPSPNAEPFKLWLAKVGHERIQDMSDPSRSLDRAREYWKKHGRSEKWIQQRMMGQETRNKLTDYWKDHEIKGEHQYAVLTNIIHHEWSGVSVKEHKAMKRLSSQSLRDHMSEAELIFTALAELSTRQIAEADQATGMKENSKAGKKGGKISKNARLALERRTGRHVVTGDNFLKGIREARDGRTVNWNSVKSKYKIRNS